MGFASAYGRGTEMGAKRAGGEEAYITVRLALSKLFVSRQGQNGLTITIITMMIIKTVGTSLIIRQ